MMARMEQERKELYQAHAQRLALTLQNQTEEEFADSRFQVLSELTRLRQLCCDPALVYDNYEVGSAKLDLCIELIQSAVEAGHKILLFSQFTSMIEILTARLQKENIRYFCPAGKYKKRTARQNGGRVQPRRYIRILYFTESRRNRTESDRCRHCHSLRSMVECCRGKSGNRPRTPHWTEKCGNCV